MGDSSSSGLGWPRLSPRGALGGARALRILLLGLALALFLAFIGLASYHTPAFPILPPSKTLQRSFSAGDDEWQPALEEAAAEPARPVSADPSTQVPRPALPSL